MRRRYLFQSSLLALTALAGTACVPSVCQTRQVALDGLATRQSWGQMPDGRPVHLFTLKNARGMTMQVSDYGGTIVSLTAPDRNGNFADIVLGYDRLEDYRKASPYFGALIGRYGNRIADGRFTLDGKTYPLATNDQPGGIPCHLHGGTVGFDKVVWDAQAVVRDGAVCLQLHHFSPDGTEGYPGNLNVIVYYWLTDDNTLRVEYEATTDQATPVNLTQHSYFNLAGHNSGTILDHELMIHARYITAVTPGLIPTGERMPVEGTPFDFTRPTAIGKRVDADHEQIRLGPGYDHNFVLADWDGTLQRAATVYEPGSGRLMEVWTTEPGLQFYCGNFLDGSNVGKGGHAYQYRTGFCLEAQHFPDSPNQATFPSTILRPGEVYRQTTEYRFSAR